MTSRGGYGSGPCLVLLCCAERYCGGPRMQIRIEKTDYTVQNRSSICVLLDVNAYKEEPDR